MNKARDKKPNVELYESTDLKKKEHKAPALKSVQRCPSAHEQHHEISPPPEF